MDIENTDDEVLTSVTRVSDSQFSVSYTASSSSSSSSSGSGFGGFGTGKGFGDSTASTSGAGPSHKGFPMLRRFLKWGRPSTSGGL